jgi:hypothetical protein
LFEGRAPVGGTREDVTRLYEFEAVPNVLVTSNSTRTESCVAIRPDPKAQVQVDVPKMRIVANTSRSFLRAGECGRV